MVYGTTLLLFVVSLPVIGTVASNKSCARHTLRATDMQKKYYLVEDGEQVGPYTIEEISMKNISENTLVWSPGMKDWTKASEVIGLCARKNIVPPPPPNATTEKGTSKGGLKNHTLVTVIIILVLAILIAGIWIYTSNKEDERRLEQIEVQKIEKERNAQKQQDLTRRIHQLKGERLQLLGLIKGCELKSSEAGQFHLFRTRKDRIDEINALTDEYSRYMSRLIEVDAELVSLGEKSLLEEVGDEL